MITARQIERFRKRQSMSREALADKVGVSSQTVWRWEKGETIPEPSQRVLRHIIELATDDA